VRLQAFVAGWPDLENLRCVTAISHHHPQITAENSLFQTQLFGQQCFQAHSSVTPFLSQRMVPSTLPTPVTFFLSQFAPAGAQMTLQSPWFSNIFDAALRQTRTTHAILDHHP